MVDRHEAARMFGVSARTWGAWEQRGRVRCCGRNVEIPGTGTRQKLYPLEQLRQVLEEFQSPPPFPPIGFVDRHGACRMFGVAPSRWSTWEKEGRIRCGLLAAVPGKPGQQKIYPVDELRGLVEEFREVEPFPPPGFVGREEASRMFGVGIRTWVTWEGEGRITCGQSVRIPGKPGRCKLYPVEEVRRLAEEFSRRHCPYPDPDRPGCYRVPVVSRVHAGMEAIIDAESLPAVEGKRWNWSPGTREGEGVVVLAFGGTPKPPLHQVVMGVRGREFRMGHLNGDPLDCRRENLVVRTASEQKAAARKVASKGGRACSSRFKGVTRASPRQRWRASIVARGRVVPLGRFRSEVDAAAAYDAAARELYGAHARLNLPDPAEAERLRAAEPVEESGPFPPTGMVDRYDACRMFDISPRAWVEWERKGRIRCGEIHPLPNGKGGRCKLYPVRELERLREEFGRLGKPYLDPDRPGCYRVPLKSYLCHREAVIDAGDLPLVEGRNWNWSPREDGVGGGQVVLATVTGRNTPLARLVAGVTGAGQRVAHANGNSLDCRRENVLVKTIREQVHGNRKMATQRGRPCTSKYKGVCWCAERGKWIAQIKRDGQHRHLGRFNDEIAAAEAYDEAAREFFGKHAHLNFPDGIDAALEQAA
jgi:hypothetical protein